MVFSACSGPGVQPYCRIGHLVESGVAQRQAASRYLRALVGIGVLEERKVGHDKLFVNPRLMRLLTDEEHRVPGF